MSRLSDPGFTDPLRVRLLTVAGGTVNFRVWLKIARAVSSQSASADASLHVRSGWYKVVQSEWYVARWRSSVGRAADL